MGLDMYLTGRKFFWRNYEERDDERKEDGYTVESMDVRLGYWRKHPNLHGYMVKTFGHDKDDCKEIELTAEDLRQTIGAVKAGGLPPTSGFFFGESDGSEKDEDLKILGEALTWLEATDPDPFGSEVTEGPGFTAVIVKPKEDLTQMKAHKPQRVSRSVHYRGDW
jgi:hypothetical protein